jgi:hypothetical protein
LKNCSENLEDQARKSRRKEKIREKQRKITDTKSKINKSNAPSRDERAAEII